MDVALPVKLLNWTFSSFRFFTIEDGACQFAGNWHRLGAERARHPRRPLPGQPPHPWPVLMPTVNTQKDFSKDAATLIAPGSLPGRSHCSDTDSKVTVSEGSEDRLSCLRQSLPGYRILEGLHCHQQSFSSVHSQQTARRNALCCFPFVPFAYLLLKHARKHFRHESNCKTWKTFIYLIPVTLILIVLPIFKFTMIKKRSTAKPVMPLFQRGYCVHNTWPVFQLMLFNEIIMSRLVI